MKVGDYVNILPGVHDESMPNGRRDGLIVEFVEFAHKTHPHGRDQVIVMFSNGAFLKFHKSQIRIIQ
jgi:hypothetical protein|tara:strand:+ start:2707 stop:2907 length:201 start_codon:yes stop_codon:yes gene_type:complete